MVNHPTPQQDAPTQVTLMRSAWVMVIRLIFFELLALVLYLGVRFVTYQLDLTELVFGGELSATLLKAGLFSVLEITVAVVVIVQWIANYYILRQGELVYVYGFLGRRERTYNIINAQNVVYEQGIIGRIFNYGKITIFSPALKQDLIMSEVSNPKKVAAIVSDLSRGESAAMAYLFRR